MEKNNLNLHVPENYNGNPIVVEVIEREGRAAEIIQNQQFNVSGLAIVGIGKYIAGRNFRIAQKDNEGIILYSLDPDNAFIEFKASEQNPLAARLHAKLEKNPDLVDFQINKDYYFDQNSLVNFVKKHAHCFTDFKKAEEFISNLRNFEVRYEQLVAKEDDRKGNTKNLEENAIKFAKGAIDLKWSLTVPLFKGTEPVQITLDLEIQKNNRTNLPEFGFYSMDVERLWIEQASEIVIKEVHQLEPRFVCLEKI